MRLLIFGEDKIVSQTYENISNLNYDGNTLSFTSVSINYNFGGFKQYYVEVDDASTLKVGDSVTDGDLLSFIKSQKHIEILDSYYNAQISDVISSLSGSDGNKMIFSYGERDQLTYNKIGTLFALNPNLDSHIIGSKSHGLITIARQDFITFINDCDTNESQLYNKFDSLRKQIDDCTDAQSVEKITW